MVIFKHFPVTIYQNLVHKCHNKPVTKVKQIVVIIDASKLRKFPHNVRIVDHDAGRVIADPQSRFSDRIVHGV